MQIIVYMPLLHLSMPQNAYITSLVFLNLANFDILPSRYFYNAMFDFDSHDMTFGARFKSFGFAQMGFLHNSGSTLFFLLFWLFLVFLHKVLTKTCKNKKV